jgi:hypothetical protein
MRAGKKEGPAGSGGASRVTLAHASPRLFSQHRAGPSRPSPSLAALAGYIQTRDDAYIILRTELTTSLPDRLLVRAEHHLQAAISAAAIRAASSRAAPSVGSPSSSNRSGSTSNLKPPPPVAENLYHIPTPDATGVVADYATLYVPQRWTDPSTYVRFSDTVEETSAGPIGLGYSYTLDERDDEWLKNNNRIARGEGTSASGAMNGAGSPTDAAGRGSRGKGKDREREKEDSVVPVMTEDEFELVMALMERWTDEKVPTLHTVRPASRSIQDRSNASSASS